MANSKNAKTFLLALLCLVLLSEVGVLMAEVQTVKSTPTPGRQIPDVCPKKCAKRCSRSWKPKMCNKTCLACCHRCPDRCVPNGPTASRDSCRCYSQIKYRGRPKCP